ncbi:MAG: AAA family ATPase [Proteobacteria bacterium]|nr:AAA family ATPase [Pseudomonadota bacterium]
MAQHLSIRIPWKDNGFSGKVCDRPCFNTSCTRLKNIAENKNDSYEGRYAGQSIKQNKLSIPCLAEGGCFMSQDSYTRQEIHPYKKSNPSTHGHFLPTELRYPPFSLPARPFAWTMLCKKDAFGNEQNIEDLAEKKGIDYDPDNEPDLYWKSGRTNWVQDADNQRKIFKAFYEDVEIDKSLVVAYAKQVPFIEEAKRIVMGIGFVKSIQDPPDHKHTNDGELRSILWETMIGHSIREDRKNGFLMPYKEMMEYAEKHPEFGISSIAVLTDDEFFDEFSYATEQLSHDAVISVLLKTIKALKIIKDCIPGNWKECIKWCKARLKEVWLDRGPFPGLGSMLVAIGFKYGELIAKQAKRKINNISYFEMEFFNLFDTPRENFSKKVCSDISKTKLQVLTNKERWSLFWLLSRINLSEKQAKTIFDQVERKKMRIECTDTDILENPYILYEKTRCCEPTLQISVNKIDMAVFPDEVISELKPVPDPAYIASGDDQRRIRALIVSVLESQADNGHTVYPQFELVEELKKIPMEPECDVSVDVMNAIELFLKEEMVVIDCEDDNKVYQLKRLYEIDNSIRKFVEERQKAERFNISENWEKLVNEYFNRFGNHIDKKEQMARKEKVAILKEMANARFSVLIGGAGTGKTTLLSLLCKSEQIRNGGILLLAPTGKARVKISKTMNEMGVKHTAFTIAQFLIRNDRFDWQTMRYRLSFKEARDVPSTVIIDESSMMTEEMFGALVSALPKAQRVIFVGDPNQLPPIGAGRPFVDLVRYLKHGLPAYPEPQVTKGFGELTVTRRQSDDGESDREDTQLAECFKESSEKLDDQLFIDLQGDKLGKHITFKSWTTTEDLQQKIFETICKETGMKSIDDAEGFDISLGGKINNGWMNFGSMPSKLDSWQILSAYKNDANVGSSVINRIVHEKYRSQKCVRLTSCQRRGTENLLGTDGIVYGDKVINVRNQKKDGYLCEKNLDEKYNISQEYADYVANGEVGIVERLWEKKKGNKANQHQIRFNSQPLHTYNWFSSVSEEGNNDLELAYALTIHKSQGSEFGTVILVLNEPSRMISRELLYTALTRQRNRIVILYNDEAYKLKKYSSVEYSDIARRFTCLFSVPQIVKHNNQLYEYNLIHKTKRGEMVRSKSEVIIADALFNAGIDYSYEEELTLNNGVPAHPDFTIHIGGNAIYWEHLGMLQKEDYRRKWDIKRKTYEKNGIVEGRNLIVSKDGLDGSIDSQEIDQLIKEFIMR